MLMIVVLGGDPDWELIIHADVIINMHVNNSCNTNVVGKVLAWINPHAVCISI